jgi:protein tyrosine phosphatase (PTP) superfamily phosphohydrolase (DUF442 family)
MRAHFLMAAGLLAASWLAVSPARAQEVTKDNLDGVVNFHRIQTVVACTGAIKPEASEPGANLEEEAAAAKSAGLRYYSVPFNAMNPDPAAADKFLDAITTKGVEPSFIHCAGGGRAATMWFIKRMVVDHWDEDRAEKEATDLGMNNPKLKQFAIDYAMSHKR